MTPTTQGRNTHEINNDSRRMTSTPQQPDSHQPRSTSRAWIPFAVVGTIVLIIIIASSVGGGADNNPPATPTQTQLEVAQTACSAGEVSDGGHTLVVDTAGDDTGSGPATLEGLACVLEVLDAPTSVTAQLEQTRALDGMQDATWGGLSATWTYHPDNGLDIVITDT